MTALFKKLQLPATLDEIIVLNKPEGFDKALQELENVNSIESLVKISEADFALVFVTEKKQIENRIETLYPKLIGDAILWFAYPKKTSTKYTTEISRDYGWGVLGDYNVLPVRQISIDENWSAIRFRKVSFIKNLARQSNIGMGDPKTSDIS